MLSSALLNPFLQIRDYPQCQHQDNGDSAREGRAQKKCCWGWRGSAAEHPPHLGVPAPLSPHRQHPRKPHCWVTWPIQRRWGCQGCQCCASHGDTAVQGRAGLLTSWMLPLLILLFPSPSTFQSYPIFLFFTLWSSHPLNTSPYPDNAKPESQKHEESQSWSCHDED